MTLTAASALHNPVLRVSAEARPSECVDADGSTIYAVVTASDGSEQFLGLVTPQDAARVPGRIFADLLPTPRPPAVAQDTPLDHVLPQLDRAEAVAVLDAGGRFIGAITRASLFSTLWRREREATARDHHRHVLELLAGGAPLPDVLTALVRSIEEQCSGPGSVLVLEEDGKSLRIGAAPNLPDAYNRAVDGLTIGPCAGSCGTAAHRKEVVVVEDIATDPLWAAYKHLALPHGLRACWSQPILSSDRRALGTFAIYTGSPHRPSDSERQVVASAAHFAGIAIERARSEEKLRRSENRLRAIVTNSADGIVTITDRGIIESFNPAAERLFGYARAEVLGHNVTVLMPAPDCVQHDGYLRRYLAGGQGRVIGIGPREVIGRRKDGSAFPMDLAVSEMTLDDGRRFIGLVRDITERKRDQDRLDRLAHYDAVTGLPNRRLFVDRLEQSAISAARHRRVVAVLFLDLDRFKTINDTLGHEAGDAVLKAVADRLQRCVREGDTVARLGGDEYAIALADMAQGQDAAAVARKILDEFAQPIRTDSHELFVTTSIGITLYPADADRIDQLLKNADTAMYRAKEHGRNAYQFYTANMNAKAVERLELETDLRRALERNEFLLHYQPKVDLATGRILGVEALVRWMRGARGMVSPAEFIPLAEETGLIVPIGDWVLRTACAQAKAWMESGIDGGRISVNVSARQFRQPDFAASVASILQKTGLPSHLLDLEVTESLLIEDNPAIHARFQELRAMGVTFSIDDFGTGYSSLSYLKRFPLDTLKIDRSFVRDLAADPDHAAIASAIISLAHSLRLHVVAEGVETEEQAAMLRSLGCDVAQGYLYSRPQPADAVEALLRRGALGATAPRPAGASSPSNIAA